MKLILQKDVKNLGKAGDQVLVKKGYARNFLIPQGQAIPLNKDRLRIWKHQKVLIEAKKRKAATERKALVEKLSSISLKFEKESLKDGKLFGSVTAYDISQTLEKFHNISVDKRDISLTTLKTVGAHQVTISLDSKHQTNITVNIKGKITKKAKQDSLVPSKITSSKKEQENPKEMDKKAQTKSFEIPLKESKVKSADTSSKETKKI